MRFTAKIENGKISWHDIEGLARYLYESEGECYIDIKPSNIRNTAQNNYYWRILRDFGNHVGYEAEEMHDVCKGHFKITSTKELNVDEFSDYIDSIIRWAAKQGFPVKDPRSTKLP